MLRNILLKIVKMTQRNELYYPQKVLNAEKYRAIPKGYMTVGEVAKKMDVTVRTLQHYDKEGLLSPIGREGWRPQALYGQGHRQPGNEK